MPQGGCRDLTVFFIWAVLCECWAYEKPVSGMFLFYASLVFSTLKIFFNLKIKGKKSKHCRKFLVGRVKRQERDPGLGLLDTRLSGVSQMEV